MKILIKLSVLLGLVGLAAAAWGQDVHYDYDRDANFASYKTYQWVDAPVAANWINSGIKT